LRGKAPTEIYTLSLHDALPIFLVQDVLGQGDDHRAHAALLGRGEGALDHFDGAFRAFDLCGPFGQAAEDLAVVDLLEGAAAPVRSEEHTSELQSRENLVCRLLL